MRINKQEDTDMLKHAPRIAVTTAAPCGVCGSADRKLAASGQDYEYETCDNEWQIWSCTNCSHMQLDPRPADDTLSIIYPTTYYSYNMEGNVSSVALKCKAFLDRLKFEEILSHTKSLTRTYLDVGCGDGRYLRLMTEIGLHTQYVHGLELDAGAVQRALSRGLNVRQCKVEDADHLPEASIDLVTMFHVIEHVANPAQVIASLRRKMSGGSTLVIETPNVRSLDARLFGKRYWGGYHFPRHWHVFTPESLCRLLEEGGFEVIHIKYQPGHAFWLFSLHHWLKYKLNLPRLAKLVNPLKSLPALAMVVAFDSFRARLGYQTSAMLVVARKTGK